MPATPSSTRKSRCLLVLAFMLALPLHAAKPPRPADASSPEAVALRATMAGEFALQGGQLDEAARWYLEAAKAVDDPGLAERATRIALLADDDARAVAGLKLWRRRAPESLPLRAAEATVALRRKDVRAARRELDILLRTPGDDGWKHALVALGTGAKDPQVAARLLGDLVDAGTIPDRLEPWLAFGGLAQRLGQPALAERIVAAVVERFPGEPRVALLRASQLREAGDHEGARKVLAGLADAARDAPELRLPIAGEYDALGDFAAAAGTLAQGPQSERIYAMRASLLARAEDKAALGALYKELGDSTKPDPERRLLLGQIAEFLERHDEALAWYRGVPGGPHRWTARLRATSVLHELKRAPEAYDELRKLQGDAAADEDTRRDAYLLESELRARDKDAPGEMDAFARGLAAYPDDPALLYSRALAWERRDDVPRAEADLRKILVADPDNTTALNALGYTLADRTQRYAEALEMIDRARVAEPDNAAIIDSYGWVLFRLGRNAEALVELKRAYTLQKDAEIATHIGEVLWSMGRRDEARRYFEEARKIDPENRALRRALEKTGQ